MANCGTLRGQMSQNRKFLMTYVKLILFSLIESFFPEEAFGAKNVLL